MDTSRIADGNRFGFVRPKNTQLPFPYQQPKVVPRRNRLEGPIAQRLEQGTHNPLVPGSNPGGPIF
jgi:hypothetical protein